MHQGRGESEPQPLSWFAMSALMAGLDVSAGGWEEGLLKMNTTFVVFVFMTHRPGLPLPGSPLVFSHS